MSAQHVTEHFRLIFSGMVARLLGRNYGHCYVAEAFTNLMKEYAVNPHHQLPTLPLFKWLVKIYAHSKEPLLQSERGRN